MKKEYQTVYMGQCIPPEFKIDQDNNVIAAYTFISERCKEYIAQGWEIRSIQLANPHTSKVGNSISGVFNVKVRMVRDRAIDMSNCEANE